MGQRKTKPSSFPLHVKPVIGSIKQDNLMRLPMSANTHEALADALGWCTDTTRYETILHRATGQPRSSSARLPNADVEILLGLNKFAFREELRCSSNVFTTIEEAKRRRRLIIEPLLNDLMSKSDLAGISLPTHEHLRGMANRRFFVQLDAAAFFDQFGLAADVQAFFGFTVAGTIMTTTVLPMGFRASCDVAQATALALIDFARPGVDAAAYIDNFFFAGDSEAAVRAAVETFMDRCRSCGVVINPNDDWFASDQDVLGEHFGEINNRTKPAGSSTRSMTTSSLAKVARATEVVQQQTTGIVSRRQMAAVFGVLFFAATVLDIPLSSYFYAIRAMRELCTGDSSPAFWDSVAPRLTATALAEVRDWLATAATNTPVPLITVRCPTAEPEVQVWVDASRWGYGYVAVTKGKVTRMAREWSAPEHEALNLGSSVVAEPRAIEKMALELFFRSERERESPLHVRIFSDHLPLVFAKQKGFGKAFMYNKMITTLDGITNGGQKIFFEICFVKGSENPADYLSRGWADFSPEIGFFQAEGGHEDKEGGQWRLMGFPPLYPRLVVPPPVLGSLCSPPPYCG